jgi:hypothetical protein
MKNNLKFDMYRLEQLVNNGKTQLKKAGENGRVRLSKIVKGLNTAPSRKIEVQQRGLGTGQHIVVRVVKRIQIPVKYIESK